MTESTDALWLAKVLEDPDSCTLLQMRQAAAELRRLHEENEILKRYQEDGVVPIRDDGMAVFMEGFGEIPLAYPTLVRKEVI